MSELFQRRSQEETLRHIQERLSQGVAVWPNRLYTAPVRHGWQTDSSISHSPVLKNGSQ